MFVVIGTTTVDVFISGLDRMPRLEGDEFTTASLVYYDNPMTVTLGGNGANSAYVLACLGAPVALCSATGVNTMGDMVFDWLHQAGIDLSWFVRKEGGTATTTAITDNLQNRMSFYYEGYFTQFTVDHIPAGLLRQASVLLVNGYALLPALRNPDFATVLATARQSGAVTALDIGPALGTPPTLDDLRVLFPHLDYFIANEHEITAYLGLDGPQALIDAGARCVIVKYGMKGAVIYNAHGETCIPGFPVEAAVTIGAGDSFNAGFLYGIGESMALKEAVRFGNATAALVLKEGKSVLGAPTREQVEALLSRRA